MSLSRKHPRHKHALHVQERDWREKLGKTQLNRQELQARQQKLNDKRARKTNLHKARRKKHSGVSTKIIIITTLVLLTSVVGAMAIAAATQTSAPGPARVNRPYPIGTVFLQNNNGTSGHRKSVSDRNEISTYQRTTAHAGRSHTQPRSVSHRDQTFTQDKAISHRPKDEIANKKSQVSSHRLFSQVSDSASKGNSQENKDLHYPMSNCKYDDMYQQRCQVVRLTPNNIGATKILDFWGEGRISEGELITGFPDSYNVNSQHQKVSNGINKSRNIPNRIPTQSYTNVDIQDLVANDTFQYVTTMGSLIIPESAQEMYRIVRKDDDARIIFYGSETNFIDRIQIASQDSFIFMQHSTQYVDRLESQLKEPTIRPINTMVPMQLVLKDLKGTLKSNDKTTSAKILLDLARYCHSNYSRSGDIREQVRSILLDSEDKNQLAEAVHEHASSREQANSVLEKFGIETIKMKYGC